MFQKDYRAFQEIRNVPKGLEGFARGNRGLQEVTEWFQVVARGSMELQGVTGGYKKLQGAQRGYRGLQWVIGGYKGLKVVNTGS